MEQQISENTWPADLFLLYPDNRAFLVDKSNRLRGNIPLIRQIASTAIFVLVLVLATDLKGAVSIVLTSLDGEHTQGTIQTCYSDSEGYQYVTFSFQVQAGQAKATAYTADQAFESCGTTEEYGVGSPVTVTYWPPDPSYARLTGSFDTSFGLVCLGTSGLVLLIVVAFEIWTELRKRYLARHGCLIMGRIVRSGRSWLSSERSLSVTYTFCSPAGLELTGEQSVLFHSGIDASGEARKTKGKVKQEFPSPGRPVAVLYANNTCFMIL